MGLLRKLIEKITGESCRSKKQLLEILLEEYKKREGLIGLCYVLDRTYYSKIISSKEFWVLKNHLEKNKPKKDPHCFPYWFKRQRTSDGNNHRIKFLNNLIEKESKAVASWF